MQYPILHSARWYFCKEAMEIGSQESAIHVFFADPEKAAQATLFAVLCI